MAGRRSSSIGCKSLINRRASLYVNTYEPIKVNLLYSNPTISKTICSFGGDLVLDINAQIALFRDLLVAIGQSRDCPEHRERIRKLRRNCVEACKTTCQLILPHIQSAIDEGIPPDNQNLVMLYFMAQLFLRELRKSHRLIQVVPMDMSGYYDNRAGPSNLGNVISQILLCKQITPDFNHEELCSIVKDSEEIANLLKEIGEYMPKQESNLEKVSALNEDVPNQWSKKQRNFIYKHMDLLCCAAPPNYL